MIEEGNHQLILSKVLAEVTCTEPGKELYVCKFCGYEEEKTIPNPGHAYDNTCDTICNTCGHERTPEHTYAGDCDLVCDLCGDVREASVDHTYDNTCDTVCNICGYERAIEHTYDDSCDEVCNVCDYERTDAHAYVSDCDLVCDACGVTRATQKEIVFDFGTDIEPSGHNDGKTTGSTQSYTVDDYILNLTDMDKCFENAYDAQGRAILKLGVSQTVGGFTFTVPNNVTSVIIKAAKYKTNTSKLTVNGNTTTLSFSSNDIGEYESIVVDTRVNKTVTVSTEVGGIRACIGAIIFVADIADDGSSEHTYDDDLDEVCNVCGHERQVYTPGDIDGVEGINDRDAIYLLMNSFFEEDYPLNQSGDFDGNGEVNDRDAIYLLMYSFFPDDYPLMNQ